MLWDSNKCKFLYVPPRKTVYKRTLSQLEKVKIRKKKNYFS